MECVVSINEGIRNLLMAGTWLPSLAAAAVVFFAWLTRGGEPGRPGPGRTVTAVGVGAGVLFGTWLTLIGLVSWLICTS